MGEARISIEEDELLKVGETADELGVQAYGVGGYVRDHLMGRDRTDIDCTIIGDPVKFAKELAKRMKTKAVVFPKFRTAMVPLGRYHIEFVGTRKEEYLKDSRKPIVKEGTFEDDIKRRDFTVNSMAVSINKSDLGRLVDLFGGIEDLKNRLLRTPLDPFVTFSDDPLRMMRAARFASQLEFDVADDALAAMRDMSSRIKIISQERITTEFLKIIDSPKPSVGISILYKSGILKIVFPELYALEGVEPKKINNKVYAHKDVFWHSLKVLDNIAQKTDKTWLRFAALVHDIAKPVTKRFDKDQGYTFHGHEEIGARWMKRIFRRMKFPMEHLPYVEKLVRLHGRPMALVDDEVTDSAIRRLAVKADDALEDLFTLVRSDITTKNPKLSKRYRNNYEKVFQKVIDVQEKDELREFQSPVRGDEIMKICGIKPSKMVGYLKERIEEAILEGEIPNEYEAAKNYFLKNKDNWIKEISLDKR